jgi:polysaccharide export outer membrane protein
MLKRRINAQGRMPAQLENDIAAALEAEEILVSPVVTVGVAEYQSRPISVAGAVKTPVTFQALGEVTLLEALSRAGGLNETAGSEILVTRAPENGNNVPAIRIPVKQLIDAADPEANLRLNGGEEVRVPEAGRVFVVGNVKKPGTFALQDGVESSVLKALAMAEGLMPFAAKEGYIFRREAAGSKNEIRVELRKILDRKSPDVALLANDVLYIPDNRGKRLGVAALEKALMFGTTAGATALIYSGR